MTFIWTALMSYYHGNVFYSLGIEYKLHNAIKNVLPKVLSLDGTLDHKIRKPSKTLPIILIYQL